MLGFKRPGIDLATFVGGIVRALTKGQQALPKSRREQLEKHFTKDDAGIYHPIVSVFQINEQQQVTVPNYALSRVNNIGIDSAVIRCSAKIVEVDHQEIDCELSDADHQVIYHVRPACNGSDRSFEIEINFSKKEDCEAENRLSEYLNGLVEIQDINNV